MPCCNNECLENINAACIDYTGTAFQCISTEAETLEEILIDIDSKLCDVGVDVSGTDITIDTKCITGDCPGVLNAQLSWVDIGGSGDLINISIPGVNTGTIIYDNYIVTVGVYSGNTLITNSNSLTTGITIPSTWNNGSTTTIVIDLIVGNGISPYHGTFTVPQNSSSMAMSSTLNCTANTVITTTIKTLFEMLIGKICDLQNQINVLNG